MINMNNVPKDSVLVDYSDEWAPDNAEGIHRIWEDLQRHDNNVHSVRVNSTRSVLCTYSADTRTISVYSVTVSRGAVCHYSADGHSVTMVAGGRNGAKQVYIPYCVYGDIKWKCIYSEVPRVYSHTGNGTFPLWIPQLVKEMLSTLNKKLHSTTSVPGAVALKAALDSWTPKAAILSKQERISYTNITATVESIIAGSKFQYLETTIPTLIEVLDPLTLMATPKLSELYRVELTAVQRTVSAGSSG